MDAHYVLFNSRARAEEKREMRKQCGEEGGGKPRMVRQLMGSRKVTPAVLVLIVATRVSLRTQIQEQ